MCRRASCPTCNKPTYVGCGMHVEQVLGDVPVDQRCVCRQVPSKPTAPVSKRRWWPFG